MASAAFGDDVSEASVADAAGFAGGNGVADIGEFFRFGTVAGDEVAQIGAFIGQVAAGDALGDPVADRFGEGAGAVREIPGTLGNSGKFRGHYTYL